MKGQRPVPGTLSFLAILIHWAKVITRPDRSRSETMFSMRGLDRGHHVTRSEKGEEERGEKEKGEKEKGEKEKGMREIHAGGKWLRP
jgi:hypothetical protein